MNIIKHENPFFCYSCQKLFHHKCLENWDKQRHQQHKNLCCPNCRNELPLKKWKEKLNYEESRKSEAEIMERMTQNPLSNNQYSENTCNLFQRK